jgi:nucleoside-diphosphate-sugar epimerase
MRIAVTGGSGFIGTKLVEDLIVGGHSVIIYDKIRSDRFAQQCTVADIRNRDQLTSVLSGCNAIYHLAAEHADNVQPKTLYRDVNVGGAENLVHAAKSNNINKIIFTSTVALYGLNVGIPDETSPACPFNPYGISKYGAELVLRKWAEQVQERTLVIVRPVVIFGEGNRGNVYNLLNQIAKRKFFMVGDGNNKKSMGYVCNISQFLIKTLDIEPGIYVYNYADKPDLTTNEIIAFACKAMEVMPPALRVPYWAGIIGGYFFDGLSKLTKKQYPISSIRIKKFCSNTQVNADRLKEIGFLAPYSIEEGLQRMIQKEFKLENRLRNKSDNL